MSLQELVPCNSMPDSIDQGCAQIFRGVIGLADWDDARLLAEPLEAINVDSLTLLEFVMNVEVAYGVELDEAVVSRCRTIGEVAAIVAAIVAAAKAANAGLEVCEPVELQKVD
jgi:acyl carrier protein